MLVQFTHCNEVSLNKDIGRLQIKMKFLLLVAIAQAGDYLSADKSHFVDCWFSPGGLHFLDPIGETAASAMFHDDEAHGSEFRPIGSLSIEKIDKADHIRVI